MDFTQAPIFFRDAIFFVERCSMIRNSNHIFSIITYKLTEVLLVINNGKVLFM